MLSRIAFALAGLLPVLSLQAIAQSPPDAMETLRRTASNYREAKSIWLEGAIEAEFQGPSGEQSTEATFRLAMAEGGKLRDELMHPQAGSTRVSDGTQAWLYLPPLNQYMRLPESARANQLGGGMAAALLPALQSLDQGVDNVRMVSEESLPFGTGSRSCVVLEVVHDPGATGLAQPKVPRQFWIDRESFVVLKQVTTIRPTAPTGRSAVEQRETLTYSRVTLGESLPESLFAFRPPKGAQKVDQFAMPGSSMDDDLTGKPAADFTLIDLGGKKHSLRGQRGKVVMLDFWATWCGPCRIQMPMVEKLHHELKSKGLVVYAINQGESAETARRYLTRNKYTATTLLDPSAEVGKTYSVAGIPTLVVIDRQGKIAAHYIGVRSEEVLRDALKKAGL
jgi:thiol-disulfide isomerase/thioredoxin